jgi:hypothetical protein
MPNWCGCSRLFRRWASSLLDLPQAEKLRRDYLGWHIHFHLDTDEKRGLAKFIELLLKHGLGPVDEPKFVQ